LTEGKEMCTKFFKDKDIVVHKKTMWSWVVW